ncbi:MAG: hypothetical protein LBI78_07765, partial [Campylobacteraceae bacterium]|nr:hypothetical protein [Campylobacteraceae bacterium]
SIEECSFSELTVIQISPYVKVIRLGLTQIESMIDNKYFLENIIDNKKKTMLPSQSNLNATIKNK